MNESILLGRSMVRLDHPGCLLLRVRIFVVSSFGWLVVRELNSVKMVVRYRSFVTVTSQVPGSAARSLISFRVTDSK